MMMKRNFLLTALIAVACAGTAAHSQPGPAPGAPPPGPPPTEGTDNPYNSREGDVRDFESDANYRSRAVRDRQGANPNGTAAAVSDLVAGSEVRDKRGKVVGVIEAVEADGAVVSTGPSKVKVPLEAFGKKGDRLMIGITKSEFDKLVAAATTPS